MVAVINLKFGLIISAERHGVYSKRYNSLTVSVAVFMSIDGLHTNQSLRGKSYLERKLMIEN